MADANLVSETESGCGIPMHRCAREIVEIQLLMAMYLCADAIPLHASDMLSDRHLST